MQTKRKMTRMLSLLLTLCMVITLFPVGLTTANAAEGTTLYLKPNSNWLADGARFAVYYWNDGTSAWADMTDADGDGYYEGVVPEGYSSVIFCRGISRVFL